MATLPDLSREWVLGAPISARSARAGFSASEFARVREAKATAESWAERGAGGRADAGAGAGAGRSEDVTGAAGESGEMDGARGRDDDGAAR